MNHYLSNSHCEPLPPILAEKKSIVIYPQPPECVIAVTNLVGWKIIETLTIRSLSHKYFTGQPRSYLSLTTIFPLRHIPPSHSIDNESALLIVWPYVKSPIV